MATVGVKHEPHNSHLMAQTFSKSPGDRASGDKLTAGGVSLPPLDLSDDSVAPLKAVWG